MCPKINETGCGFLPLRQVCFYPKIVYYSGRHCLVARVICPGAFLLIHGTNLKTGEQRLWDQRKPAGRSHVYHHRWPDFAEEYLARCTEQGFWMIPAGLQKYEDVPVAIERLYCTI